MPSFTIKRILVSSLLLLPGISTTPLAYADALDNDTRPGEHCHWIGNTLTIPGGNFHDKRTHPGEEIEEWLKEALRENPDLQLNPMYQDSELEEYVEVLRKEVALERAREGQEQKVVVG